jgi:hemerythrin-like domain-containing protein
VTLERQAALLAIKEAAERLEAATRAVAEAERDLAQALADYRQAIGAHLRVEPVGVVWRGAKWHP